MPVAINAHKGIILTGLAALLASVFAASAAGLFLSESREMLALIPGLMILLPPSINMRGSISGVLASRLSSSMHLGTFEAEFKKGSILGDNLRASFAVTVLIAFSLGIIVYLVAALFGMETIPATDLLLISVISGIGSGIIVTCITLVVTLISYRLRLDLDMIAAPTVTTSGDIVTIPILILSSIFVMQLPEFLRNGLVIVILLVSAGTVIYAALARREIKDITSQLLPLLVPLCFIGTLAGVTYTFRLDELLLYPALLVLIPPFAGGCGSIGGILCSRLATDMHMGLIEPVPVPGREVMPHIVTTFIYAIIILPLMAAIAYGAGMILSFNSPGIAPLIMICMVSGIVVISIVCIFAYMTASWSFRYGLDPDNFGIPVITGLIDLIGAAIFIWVIGMML